MSISVSGTIHGNQTWSGEVLVTGPVYVPEGVTLTIEPGTRVRFKPIADFRDEQIALELDGRLLAAGTEAAPIWFTSAAGNPRNGDWAMLRMNGETGSVMHHAIIEFAQQGINLWHSDVSIKNSVVRWNNWEGIYLENNSTATIQGTLIYQNGYNGIAMEQFNTVTLQGNIIEKNGSHGVHIDASTAVLEGNIVRNNGFSGISLDNDSTLTATANTTTGNDLGFAFGEGQFDLTLGGNDASGNREGSGLSAAQAAANGAARGPADIAAVRALDTRPYELGYTPSDPLLDTYPYVFPDDATRSIEARHGEGLGLTWSIAVDGDTLWTATLSGQIYQLDAATGSVLKTLQAPSTQPWGMTHDGTHLWITDFAEKRTYSIDTTTGQQRFSFDNPSQEAGAKGMAWDGSHLYLMGWGDRTIYKMSRDGKLVATIALEGEGGGGITWDGNSFWVPAGKKLVQYAPDGKQLGEIYGGSEGNWDLAWDADRELLWATQRTNENWFDDSRIFGLRVYEQVQGSDAVDMREFSGARSEYALRLLDGALLASDSVPGRDGAQSLVNIERLVFADTAVAYDIDGNAGDVARILGAVFGPQALANKQYAGIGLHYRDAGMSYEDLMQLALGARLGAGVSDPRTVVDVLYTNVIGSAPSDDQAAPFVQMLESGQHTPASLAVMAAATPFNTAIIDLVGLAQSGLDYLS